jgi:nucleotide-binding universal stress UspA family protein
VPVLVERAWQPVRRELLLSDRPRLLVPLDGSPFAETVLDIAAGLADDIGAELILLRVEPDATQVLYDDYGRVLAYLDELDEQARSLASDYLDSVAAPLAEQWPGVSLRTEVRFGQPSAAIDQTVTRTGAALVVMATHGYTGLRRSVMGSVAGQVLERGNAPLVLLRPRMPVAPDLVTADVVAGRA